jgi:hypothetical protein
MAPDDEDTPHEFDADAPTRPDGGPALKEIAEGEITKPHDGKEWLKGFERGRMGGTADVLNALLTELRSRGVTESDARLFVSRVHMRAKGLPVGPV